MINKLILSCTLIIFSYSIQAYDSSLLTQNWQHTPFQLYLSAQEAYDLKKNNPDKVLLVDIRNQAEIHYTGMTDLVDANIPYRFDSSVWKMKKNSKYGTFKLPKNPDFVTAFLNLLQKKNLTKNSPIILMCATGTRVPFAAKKLYKAGFTKIYTQVEGFEGVKAKKGPYKGKRIVSGWKVSNLPWSYDLAPKKMYFNFAPQNNKGKSN